MRRLLPAPVSQTVPEEPLRGVPKVRRLKNYASESGFTWAYYYEGYRLEQTPEAARAHLFTLLAGGSLSQQLTVVVPETVLAGIGERAEREVSSPEIYALAKMYLFSILDRDEQPQPDSRWRLSAAEAEMIWTQLDL